jgi:hypothetical protein
MTTQEHDDMTCTITSVGPHGVSAERNFGCSNPDGTRSIVIHEADSPGITRHRVGDVVPLKGQYAGPYAAHARLVERLPAPAGETGGT